MISYYFHDIVNGPFENVVVKVSEALKKEGFGIITTIDLKKTFREKLNIDYGNHIIPGACSPYFAHQALSVDRNIGLLLPWNVVIRETDKNVIDISAIDPVEILKIVDNQELKMLAEDMQNKLSELL